MSMTKETWRKSIVDDIEVSDLGNIRKNGVKVEPSTDNRGRKKIYANHKIYFVHRLVAFAFPEICGEYFENAVIDHIDTDVSNNKAVNLRFCTQKSNCLNPLTRKHKSISKTGIKNPMYGKTSEQHHNSKPILQLSSDNQLLQIWKCTMDVYRVLGLGYKNISLCLRGKGKTAYGYKWVFVDDYLADWWEEEMEKGA